MVRLLLEKGAPVDTGRNDGWTALMLAAEKGKADAVKALIAKGADVNVKINFMTPLKLAYRYPEVVRILKEAGAKE
jgi:ankyrin repeat protein